jgi:hypothetical protein
MLLRQLNNNAVRSDSTPIVTSANEPTEQTLDMINECQVTGVYCNAGFDTARQAGLCGQLRQCAELLCCSDLPDHGFIDSGVNKGLPDIAFGCGLQARAVVTQIIAIRTGCNGVR